MAIAGEPARRRADHGDEACRLAHVLGPAVGGLAEEVGGDEADTR